MITYLGPLASLIQKDKSSVVVYPFPDSAIEHYEHIELIVADVKSKLAKTAKSEAFKSSNTAHIAFLMYDIILLAHPIKLNEIELALLAMKVDVENKTVNRLLYLLEKIGLIKHTTYSSVKYYYDTADGSRRVRFGSSSKGIIKDTPAIKMALRQSYILQGDEQSKKRKNALVQINKIKADEAK